MRALTFQAPGEVRFESVPDAAIRGPGDALVRVSVTAICGSDLHPYRGHEVGLDAGTVMGHEFVGEVVEVGPAVRRLRPGRRVVSSFSTSCGGCFFCRRGLTSRCPRGRLFGWVAGGEGLDGAQAEYVRVPLAESTLVEVPEEVGDEEALFAGDVLATGAYCADRAEIAPEDVAVVLGCGAVGLMAALAALRLGARRVYAIDSVPERLALAAELGARALELGAPDAAQVVADATAGRGADAVLECVGSPQASRLAIDLVRAGGVISAAGFHTETRFAFSPVEAYDKNLTYRAGRCPARAYVEGLLGQLAERAIDPGRLVTHRLPLERGPEAYDLFDRRADGCVKVLMRPG